MFSQHVKSIKKLLKEMNYEFIKEEEEVRDREFAKKILKGKIKNPPAKEVKVEVTEEGQEKYGLTPADYYSVDNYW